ncbi:MAG TPA: glutaredoxin 3 [Planctomycetota bacterium]
MARVEIYVRGRCPYCVMAKRLLQSKGQEWVEIDLDGQPERIAEMLERSGGRRTVPEIFIDDRHVGGYDDLAALERDGRLDTLLA